MSLEVNDYTGPINNYSQLAALSVLDTLQQMKELADQMLAAQNKTVDTLVKGDQEQEKRLDQLTKKLEAARVPQTMQQLTAMQTKIEEALPKFKQLGDTETALKLITMLNNVEDLKQQMANRRALNSSPSTPPETGGLYA